MVIASTPLYERARGRWKTILPALGVDRAYLTGRNVPCPLCPEGGRDRFRFDNKRGDGTWICSHCGAGVGVSLALKYTGAPFAEVAQRIERIIGDAPVEQIRAEQSDADRRASLNRLWASGGPVHAGDPVDLWIGSRGIHAWACPPVIRSAPRVRFSGPPVSWHPAMISMVTDASGRPATLHKTYLTTNGRKAPIDRVRMFCAGTVPAGGAVRLAPPAAVLGIAEGIETALAAAQMFGIPTWAALNAGQLEKFEPPAGTERLVIFGDHDANGTGQRSAYALAARLAVRLDVEPRIPPHVGTDWNDVLRG